MEAGALSYMIISAGANIGNLVVPGRTERVSKLEALELCKQVAFNYTYVHTYMQFAVWVSYKTCFVSVMTTLCVKFSAGDGLYPTGLFLRMSDNIRILVA